MGRIAAAGQPLLESCRITSDDLPPPPLAAVNALVRRGRCAREQRAVQSSGGMFKQASTSINSAPFD